ncbi:unnamed protein product, partial [Didymodactylos carnosus]
AVLPQSTDFKTAYIPATVQQPTWQPPIVVLQPQKPIDDIPDFLPWSYINILCGGILLGCISVCCSMCVQNYKQQNDYVAAKRCSIITAIWNALVIPIAIGIAVLIFKYAGIM